MKGKRKRIGRMSISDDEFIKLVRGLHEEGDTATYETLARLTGMSRPGIQTRAERLIREGRLKRSPLRPARRVSG